MKSIKVVLLAAALMAADVLLASSSRKFRGYIVDDDYRSIGTVEVTVGKENKKGNSSVKGTIKFGSKKYSISKQSVQFWEGETYALKTKKLGTVYLAMYDGGVEGDVAGYSVEPEAPGYEEGDGMLDGEYTFSVDGYPEYDGDGEIIDESIPDNEPVYATNGKWKTDKAGSLKLKKYKDGDYEIIAKGESNFGGLKLKLNKKKGTFSGSFKVKVLVYNKKGDPSKLKSYTYKIKGTVQDGEGVGVATNKKLGDVEVSIQ